MMEKVEKNAWMFVLAPAIAPTKMVMVPKRQRAGDGAINHECICAVVAERAEHRQQRAKEQLLLREAKILLVQLCLKVR